MNINNLNYRPPMTYNEPNKEQENRTMNRTMTREEAIKIIDCYDIGFYDLSGAKIPADKLADAFDMAIEALEQEPSEDLISRQDAIDELEYEAEMLNRVLDDMYVVSQEREKFAWGLGLVECFIEDIKELPSKEIINVARLESDTE